MVVALESAARCNVVTVVDGRVRIWQETNDAGEHVAYWVDAPGADTVVGAADYLVALAIAQQHADAITN